MESIKVQRNSDNFLKKVIIFSFVLHFCALYIQLKDDFPSNFIKKEVALSPKIILQLKNRVDSKQIVQTETSNNQKTKTDLLSAKNNKVLRETKNRNIGKFAAARKGLRKAVNQKRNTAKVESKTKASKKLKLSDFGVKASEQIALKKIKKKSISELTRKGIKSGQVNGRGLGSSNDYLEDIPLGDFTKLNTQEYEFYGFYHRIRQKLEQFWGSNLQTQAEKILKQGRSIASDNNLVTSLTIKLNSAGEIVDIILNSTSGVKELDDAAVKSFNQAGPFPNPPKGMIKNDGKASIEWGFVVNT